MCHHHAHLLLLLIVGVFFARPLWLGEVVFPHDNSREVGAAPVVGTDRASNRKFSDQSSVFVPELHHHLRGSHAGWISTWNPHVELGRPTHQTGGIGKSFWLVHLLSLFSDDAFRVYTWLSVLSVLLSGTFALLLFRLEGLVPAACLVGALGICLGVFVSYWLTFNLFIWGIAFTLALLWLVGGFLRRPTLLRGVGISVAVHSLLLTAYPQQIVWHLYVLAVYVLVCLHREPGAAWRRARSLLWVALAGFVGLLSVTPTYLDLYLNMLESSRRDVSPEFFLSVLPPTEGWRDALLFTVQLVDASLLGDPIDPGYPASFNGLTLTPLYFFFVTASFLRGARRRLWAWKLFVLVCLLATVWPPAYRFGVEHLGLSISRFIPLAGAWIPLALLWSHGADRVLRSSVGTFVPLAAVVMTTIAWATALGFAPGSRLEGGMATASILALLLAFSVHRSAWLLVAIAVVGVGVYSWPLRLTRPTEAIRRDSTLVQLLRQHASDGRRYAWVDNFVVPSNQEALLGLYSIHTYNSLSSRRYQRWVLHLSEAGASVYGRHFQAIRGQSGLSSDELRLAGVAILGSTRELDPTLATPIRKFGRLGIYRTREEPILADQLLDYRVETEGRVEIDDEKHGDRLPVVRRIAFADDLLRFELEAVDAPSLLFLSQQYHRHWRARSGTQRLPTVVVDGFYQGVRVPPNTDTVELEFMPYVRHAWLPQLLLLLATAGSGLWERIVVSSGISEVEASGR